MSDWDEKAEDYAVAHHTYDYLSNDENAYYTSGFVRGARWQREALLSDETVERAARAFYEAGNAPAWQGSMRLSWDRMVWGDPRTAKNYRVHMRAALMAAIEGSE